MSGHTASATARVDLDDIQGLVRFGFKHHTEAVFLLLRVRDAKAARAWLKEVPITSAITLDPLPPTALQIALTSEGLRALGVDADIVASFSEEFVNGLGDDPSRARRLGDVDSNDPEQWNWGKGQRKPHVAVLLYALPGQLAPFQQSVELACQPGFEITHRLETSDMGGVEPFGFVDGISQPELDWGRMLPGADREQMDYLNLSSLGEFLLGYPNEYGLYTPRPTLDALRDPSGSLPRAEEAPDDPDLGRNGSYLVMRQIRQDVQGFWKAVDRYGNGVAAEREHIAAQIVGRTLGGKPVVAPSSDLNAFTYNSDPQGLRCPLGAHIRRTNPRNADLPPGGPGVISQLIRTLGLNPTARSEDLAASTRFHRLLRRGREYGAHLTPSEAISGPADRPDSGLHFMCLGANIQRQFEFVQSAWIMSSRFNGLHGENDPLLGNRSTQADGIKSDYFSMPQANGPARRLSGLPQFVTVLGGAYFFLPGIRALRYLAT